MVFSSLKQHILELSLYPRTVFLCVFICSVICHCVRRDTTVDSTGFFHRDIQIAHKFFLLYTVQKGTNALLILNVCRWIHRTGPRMRLLGRRMKACRIIEILTIPFPFTPATNECRFPTASKKEALSNWVSPVLKGEKTSHCAYFCCCLFFYFFPKWFLHTIEPWEGWDNGKNKLW